MVQAVEDEIASLPSVSLDSLSGLEKAKELYESLPGELQKRVDYFSELEKAFSDYHALVYEKAEQLYSEGSEEEALDYYNMLPSNYEESSNRIAEIQASISLREGQEMLCSSTWIWDGVYGEGSDGSRYPADYNKLSFRRDEMDKIFIDMGIPAFSVIVSTELVDPSVRKESLLNPLPNGYEDEISAGNMDLKTFDFKTEIPEGDQVWVSSGRFVKSSGWTYNLSIDFHLQEDGRLRLDYNLHTAGKQQKDVIVSFFYDAV